MQATEQPSDPNAAQGDQQAQGSGNPLMDALQSVHGALDQIIQGVGDKSPQAAKLFQQAQQLFEEGVKALSGGGQGPPVAAQQGGNSNAQPMG